jgi:hypothetical protein
MPVEIKMKNQSGNDQLFLKLPPGGVEMYKAARAAGVEFTLAFYSVTANMSKFGIPNKSVTLPASTTSLMKGSTDPVAFEASAVQLIALLKEVVGALNWVSVVVPTEPVNPQPAEPNPPKVVGNEDNTSHKVPETKAAPSTPVEDEPKPTSTPIRLLEAKALGQPVHGSSSGSIYYTVAISPRVKLAARVTGYGKVSIRAEGLPSDYEAQRLKACGMSKAGAEHWSIHFDQSNVPVSRIIGAFVMGLEIDFQRQVTSANQIKVDA